LSGNIISAGRVSLFRYVTGFPPVRVRDGKGSPTTEGRSEAKPGQPGPVSVGGVLQEGTPHKKYICVYESNKFKGVDVLMICQRIKMRCLRILYQYLIVTFKKHSVLNADNNILMVFTMYK
jgi:hypothetical protein